MLRKRFISQTIKATMIMWSDYSNYFLYIILVLLDVLRAPNYSSEEMLIKSCKIQTDLQKHPLYFYRTDFTMKRSHIVGTITSLNVVKKCKELVNFSCYEYWPDLFLFSNLSHNLGRSSGHHR